MLNNNCLAIVFSNTGDDNLSELTSLRTMGSVPFGSRYRLVDFMLSNLVNAGISQVGLVTKRNYRSLQDHVGNGRSWDLARKKGGLCILSPYSLATSGVYKGKIDALHGCIDYLNHSPQDYVFICDSNVVSNFDLEPMVTNHIESGADISMAYKKGINGDIYLTVENDRIKKLSVGEGNVTDNCSLGIILMKKELLISLIEEAMLHNFTDFSVDVLQRKADSCSIIGYEVKEYVSVINSMQKYFDTNMELLKGDIRKEVFNMEHPVFTKLRDDMPTRYGLESTVSDSLIADGCLIEGNVKNSIIFRGVHVAKGANVENCILMQSAKVGEDTSLSYVVSDKSVYFKPERTLVGCHSFPLVIGKGLTV